MGFFLIWKVLLVCLFYNCILVIIIEDKKMSCFLNFTTAVDQESLELGIP